MLEIIQIKEKTQYNDLLFISRDFMNSPEIQNPKNVQDTFSTMRTKQKVYSEQRLKILEQVRLGIQYSIVQFKNRDHSKVNII